VSEKRALIVDDSKSARVVLSRMLEKYDLAVDTSDSAEHALEYLKAHRPDVIFMDHLMPGMDGLAAVQAIRSNPDTSAIPIMMYTSQEGELYLGQARALGANGVLPKRIGSTEVSRILQDLRLLDAPVGAEVGGPTSSLGLHSGPIVVAGASGGVAAGAATATVGGSAGAGLPAAASASAPGAEASSVGEAAVAPSVAEGAAVSIAAAAGAVSPQPVAAPVVRVVALDDLQRLLEPLLKQHSADLRRFVVASLDSFAQRVTETRAPAAPIAPVLAPPAPIASEARIETPAPAPRPTAWVALAAAASLAALAAGAFAWYQQRQIDSLAASLASASVSRAAPVAAPTLAEGGAVADRPPATGTSAAGGTDTARTPESAAPAPVPAPTPAPAIAPVAFPYGAPPFADARLARLSAVLADLEGRSERGVLTATVHSADFCLTGNPAEGYALAPEEMPADRCDVVGNPHYDGLRTAQRPGTEYADVAAALRARTSGALDVRVVDAGRQGAVAAYPSGGGASAQQWNAAAATNQRIEFAFAPSAGPGTPP
jgi:CheY-like chemotaxis protein